MTAAIRNIASQAPSSSMVDLPKLIADGAALYRSGGLRRGSLPGWGCMNSLYTVAPGMWTVITGTPGSGKSEWLDSLLVNLAESEDWEFCIYSPENYPVSTHLVKLVEKRMRLPFGEGPNKRMTLKQYHEGAAWVAEHFFWIEPELRTPLDLIETGLAYRQTGKKLGIVLDPWNTLEHDRRGMSETDYVSFILTEVTKLARASHAHIWLVAHPAKLQRNRDGTRPVPTPYDIAGSAAWYAKADNILCVHRDQAEGGQDVEIHVQKIRFKHIGSVGFATLKYDKVVGRYFDYDGCGIPGEQYADPERGQEPPVALGDRE
jgi:twinkle protein